MKSRLRSRTFAVAAVAMVAAALAPLATADAVYHSEHLDLAATSGAPLRSGFVENIKAEGPRVYAHEIFVLNGAVPKSSYTVTRHFFFLDPECDGDLVFASDVAELNTNAGGNSRADIFVTPGEAEGLEGLHGVVWTVQNSRGLVDYRTICTTVTLD